MYNSSVLYEICFRHLVLVEMTSFEKIFQTVAQQFAIYNVSNLGTKLLCACYSACGVIHLKFLSRLIYMFQISVWDTRILYFAHAYGVSKLA